MRFTPALVLWCWFASIAAAAGDQYSDDYGHNVYDEGRVNRSCKHYANYCRSYRNERCDRRTLRCACTADSVYDPVQRRCRDAFCYERCMATGYECQRNECRLCWTRDGRYLCDRPEVVWIAMAYAALGAFVLTVTAVGAVELGCCCRRRKKGKYDFKEPARLRRRLKIAIAHLYDAEFYRRQRDAIAAVYVAVVAVMSNFLIQMQHRAESWFITTNVNKVSSSQLKKCLFKCHHQLQFPQCIEIRFFIIR